MVRQAENDVSFMEATDDTVGMVDWLRQQGELR